MSFANRVVLVTGASSGIGASTAILFSGEGAKVVMVGRNETKLKEVTQKCEKKGSKPLVIKADVSKDEDAKRIIKETVDKFGRIDVLINNAAITKFGGALEENSLKNFDDISNTNLRAVVHLTNLASPYIIKTKGNIINISSAVATCSSGRSVLYSTLKAALDHFTRCVALELAPHGVRVNTVNPGPVNTDFIVNNTNFSRQESDKFLDEISATLPLKRASTPEEMADLILFLASDKAKSITGSSYFSDNGYALNH